MQLLPPRVMSCSIAWLVLAALYPFIKASPFVRGRSGVSYRLGRADRLKSLQRRLDCTYSTSYGRRLPGTTEHHMSHCYKPALCASRYLERSKFHSCTPRGRIQRYPGGSCPHVARCPDGDRLSDKGVYVISPRHLWLCCSEIVGYMLDIVLRKDQRAALFTSG